MVRVPALEPQPLVVVLSLVGAWSPEPGGQGPGQLGEVWPVVLLGVFILLALTKYTFADLSCTSAGASALQVASCWALSWGGS